LATSRRTGEHEVAVRDDVLQSGAPITKRPRRDVAAVAVQEVERHEDGPRGNGSGVGVAQPVEARTELLV
jgi:hypothetical protein